MICSQKCFSAYQTLCCLIRSWLTCQSKSHFRLLGAPGMLILHFCVNSLMPQKDNFYISCSLYVCSLWRGIVNYELSSLPFCSTYNFSPLSATFILYLFLFFYILSLLSKASPYMCNLVSFSPYLSRIIRYLQSVPWY